MQTTQVSVPRHNQRAEEERHCRAKERESCLATQQMFASAAGGAFQAPDKRANKKNEDSDERIKRWVRVWSAWIRHLQKVILRATNVTRESSK